MWGSTLDPFAMFEVGVGLELLRNDDEEDDDDEDDVDQTDGGG